MSGHAEGAEKVVLPGGCEAVFAPLELGQTLLTTEDDYLRSLGKLDREVRMKKSNPTAAEWQAFLKGAAMEWKPGDVAAVREALKEVSPMIGELHLGLPKELLFIKTSGAEEEKSAYTRGTMIFLPEPMIQGPARTLHHVVAHELCHILTRADPKLRDRLYAVLGFTPLPAPMAYPAFLEPRRLTNPDAPVIQHSIKVRHEGVEKAVTLVISLPQDHFDEKTGLPGFKNLELHLVPVDPKTGQATAASNAGLIEPQEVTGLIEQIGRNTGYILHPEEILADNVALLLLQRQGVPSPEILERLREVLLSGQTARSTPAASPR